MPVNPDSIPRYADPNADPRYHGPKRIHGRCKYCHVPRDEAFCVWDVLHAEDPDDEDLVEVDPSEEGCGRWEESKWA